MRAGGVAGFLVAAMALAACPAPAIPVATTLATTGLDNSQTLEIYLPPGSLAVSVVGYAGFAASAILIVVMVVSNRRYRGD